MEQETLREGRVLACVAISGVRARHVQGLENLKIRGEFGNGRRG